MLIKIQHHRISRNWLIFEDVKHVKYSAQPTGFDTLEAYEAFERGFYEKNRSGNELVFKDSHDKLVWNPGSVFFINELSFLNEQGYREHFIFDGEAYICNNDGKTVQKIDTGGFVYHKPLPEAA